MPSISTENSFQTVISTFEVNPIICQELLDFLIELSRSHLRQQPGFISASFHVNDARTRIANYSQWESRAHFQAMLRAPEMRDPLRRIVELCERFEPVLYDVVETVER